MEKRDIEILIETSVSTCGFYKYKFVDEFKFKGQICDQPTVIGEKLCRGCIFKDDWQDKVSEKFKKYKLDFDLVPLRGTTFFYSKKYKFVLEYDGEMHLKGIFNNYRDTYCCALCLIKEATQEEKELAVSLEIKVV